MPKYCRVQAQRSQCAVLRPPTLLGIPIDSGGNAGGCELSPRVLREHGLASAVHARGSFEDLPVRITGGRDATSGVVGFASVLHLTTTVRQAVQNMLTHGDVPLLVGGCCSFVMGAIAGARDVLGRVGVAYVDGHLDLYDGKTSPTGECADMPFAFLMGLAPRQLVDCMGTAHPVAAQDAALLGYRDAADAHRKGSVMPEELGGGLYLANDLELLARGPGVVGAAVRQRFEQGAGRFWVHLDFDVLSDRVCPAVDYHNPGGLDWRQLHALLRPLLSSDGLAGISLACYNPDLDPERRGASDIVDNLRQLCN